MTLDRSKRHTLLSGPGAGGAPMMRVACLLKSTVVDANDEGASTRLAVGAAADTGLTWSCLNDTNLDTGAADDCPTLARWQGALDVAPHAVFIALTEERVCGDGGDDAEAGCHLRVDVSSLLNYDDCSDVFVLHLTEDSRARLFFHSTDASACGGDDDDAGSCWPRVDFCRHTAMTASLAGDARLGDTTTVNGTVCEAGCEN